MGKSSFYVLAFLISLTFLSGFLLSSSRVSADDSVVDDINITIPVACTLSGVGMTSHNATINNGTYDSEIGTTTLKAFCNDSEGFAIYAAGYTGDEIGGTNSNKLVGQSYNQTIVTGTATSAGNPDVSNWAMKLATITSPAPTYPIIIAGSTSDTLKQSGDPDFSNYTSVPNEYVKVAYRTSNTDVGTNAEGSTLTTTYAAYISKNQVADSYQGKVIYTMIHPAYADATGCNPNATTISDTLCMQDFADVTSANRTAIINSMVEGTQYTIKDKRDGKEYKIAKLADGNVWMTQNLDLDLDAGTTYTNLDTDIGYNISTGTYDTAAWTPTRSTYATTSTQTHEWCQGGTWNSEYNYCENNNSPESYDPGNLYWNLETDDDYVDWDSYYNSCDWSANPPTCNQSLNPISTYTSSTGTSQYHLGNYYNWAAALATNDSSVYGSRDLVEQSICPAGWTLPRSGDGEDSFLALWEEYGYDVNNVGFTNISTLWSSPLYFTASGGFYGALNAVGYGGSFWSPVAGGSGLAGYAYFSVDGEAYPSGSDDRVGGNSVRCVARPVADSASGSGGGES